MRYPAPETTVVMRVAIAGLVLPALALAVPPAFAADVLLHDNGPILTGHGDGAGGADTSLVQSALEQTVTGYAASASGSTRVADDFDVPAPGWTIHGIRLVAFQTGSSPASPSVTGVVMRIWDGPPGEMGSSLVFGVPAGQAVAVAGQDVGAYRVTGVHFSDSARPLQWVDVGGLDIALHPGTYWLDWEISGTLAAGPFVPPVTRLGQAGAGNARQLRGGEWLPVSGTGSGEEFPFQLSGGDLASEVFRDGFED